MNHLLLEMGSHRISELQVNVIRRVVCFILHNNLPNLERPNGLQYDRFNIELVALNRKNADFSEEPRDGYHWQAFPNAPRCIGDLLLYRFALRQTRSHGASRLSNEVVFPWDRLWLDPAIMLVAPDYQVYRVIKHAFWDRILWSMLDPTVEQECHGGRIGKAFRDLPVLMYKHDVEPFPLVIFLWHVHSDPVAPELIMHPGVLDVPDTIHR